ncbi:MAG: winged helix-turn-helix domain-containing protein [Anaerolineaceae bacterium]
MVENEVSFAFEILLEEIETAIEELNQEGSRQFSLSDHKKARLLLEKAEAASLFRGKIKDLQIEWRVLGSQIDSKTSVERKRSNTKRKSKLKRGLRTPEEEFKIPILESLIHLGGSAKVNDVIASVGKMMASSLNDYDKQPLLSAPSSPRWRNTAQWARNALVKEGLMANDSPKGIWTITDAGRKALTIHISNEH